MKRNATAQRPPGGQPGIPASRKRDIAKRLRTCGQRLNCRTAALLADRLRIPRTTVVSWFRKEGAVTPTTANVIALAEEAEISPTWLLLGEGPELRGATKFDDLGGALRGHVARSLAAELEVNPDFVAAVIPVGKALLQGMVQQYREVVWREVEARQSLDQSKSPLARALKSLARETDHRRVREVEEDLAAWWTTEQARLAALPPLQRPAGMRDGMASPLVPPLDIQRT
jgi:hypothetical protein